eukprot:1423784-Rhodomonas_salina.2
MGLPARTLRGTKRRKKWRQQLKRRCVSPYARPRRCPVWAHRVLRCRADARGCCVGGGGGRRADDSGGRGAGGRGGRGGEGGGEGGEDRLACYRPTRPLRCVRLCCYQAGAALLQRQTSAADLERERMEVGANLCSYACATL